MGTVELDLLQYQSSEAKKESDYQTFGARVVEDLVAEILEGKVVTMVRGAPVDLSFILDGHGFISDDEACSLLIMDKEHRADYWEMIVEPRARELVKDWTEYSDVAADVIAQRVRDRVLEAEEV